VQANVDVLIQPWPEADLELFQKLLGDPGMMAHLDGPETPEQILRRHQRYLHLPEDDTDHMFRIVRGPDGEPCFEHDLPQARFYTHRGVPGRVSARAFHDSQ